MIGERLKLARQMARLSQQSLADQTGVSKMAISKYEHNQMMPGSDVLLKLADALNVHMEFFLRTAPGLDIKPLCRTHSQLNKTEQEVIMAQVQEWLERYLTVEAFSLQRNSRPSFSLTIFPIPSHELKTPRSRLKNFVMPGIPVVMPLSISSTCSKPRELRSVWSTGTLILIPVPSGSTVKVQS